MSVKKYFKPKFLLYFLLLSVLFLSSCSLNSLIGSNNDAESNFNKPGNGGQSYASDAGSSDAGSSEDMEIALTVLVDEESDEAVPAGSIMKTSNPSGLADSDTTPVQMELKLYFADRKAAEDGKPGEYGFVTPVTRHIPATSGILSAAMKELITGPLPEEQGVDPVMPNTSEVNKISIKDGIASIDFNQAFAADHKGGTLGGAVTMHSIVFTAAQFDSVDGVLVTVDGQPWDDGHFIWETPIYADELSKTFSKNN